MKQIVLRQASVFITVMKCAWWHHLHEMMSSRTLAVHLPSGVESIPKKVVSGWSWAAMGRRNHKCKPVGFYCVRQSWTLYTYSFSDPVKYLLRLVSLKVFKRVAIISSWVILPLLSVWSIAQNNVIAAVALVRPSTSQDRICTSSMIWPSLFTSTVSEQGADLQLQICSCKSQI